MISSPSRARSAIEERRRRDGARIGRIEAHNAQQAIDLLENGAQVDVVFSDVQMPGMDGFELQRWIRQHRPRIKVLLASGVENVKAASGHMGPPRWLVFKPYNMADLEQRIRDLLRG